MGHIFWVRAKFCKNFARTQVDEGLISQHQAEFQRMRAAQFPHFHGIKAADILIIIRIFRECGVRNQEFKLRCFIFRISFKKRADAVRFRVDCEVDESIMGCGKRANSED